MMKTRNLFLFLWLSLFIQLVAEGQTRLYGDDSFNSVIKVKQVDDAIYVLGLRGPSQTQVGAVFTRLTLTGEHVWTVELPEKHQINDFIEAGDGFLLVGLTRPFNFDSRSLICRIQQDGSLAWSRIYNFSNRENLTRIVPAPDPAVVTDPSETHFYIWGIVNHSLSNVSYDDQIVLHIDGEGNQLFRRELHFGDDQLQSDFIRLTNGNYVMMGGTNAGGQVGVMNNLATEAFYTGNGGSGHYLFDAVEANDKVYLAGRNGTNGYLLVLDQAGAQRLASYTLPDIRSASRITADALGNLYIVGQGDIGDGNADRNIIYKLNETLPDEQTLLQVEWVRHIDQEEDDYAGGEVVITEDNRLLYFDSRLNHPQAFGDFDFLLGIFDLDLSGECVFDLDYSISPPSLIGTPISTSLNISEEEFTRIAIFDIKRIDYRTQITCGGLDTCGRIVAEEISTVCSDPNTYTYFFQLQSLSEQEVTSIAINGLPEGYTFSTQFWTTNDNPSLPINDGEITDWLQVDIQAPFPPESSTLCFNVVLFSGKAACCHFEHCIELPFVNPCGGTQVVASATQVPGQEGCCYDLKFSQTYCPDFFIGFRAEILTEGVFFNLVNGGNNGTVSLDAAMENFIWVPNSDFIDIGSNGLSFCLDGVTNVTQIPQHIAFHWLATDADGVLYIACSDTLAFKCGGCLNVGRQKVTCNPDGTFSYTFLLQNTTSPEQTATQVLLDVETPDVVFTPNAFDVNLAPGEEVSLMVTVSGAMQDQLVNYKLLLLNESGWCCHLGGLTFSTPDCPNPNIQSGFSLEPMPATEQITLRVNTPGYYHLQIVDHYGRVHHRENSYLDVQTTFAVADLPKGMYWIVLEDEKGEINQASFLKF